MNTEKSKVKKNEQYVQNTMTIKSAIEVEVKTLAQDQSNNELAKSPSS